jgi:hypothetical protein
MDTKTHLLDRHTMIGSGLARSVTHALLGCLVAIVATGFSGDALTTSEPDSSAVCCRADAPAAGFAADRTPPVIVTSPDDDQGSRESEPDVVADHVGGIAARLHTADGTPIIGDVFLLMGSNGSTANARLYDTTPYTHDYGAHPDTIASNLLAAQTVGKITGTTVELLDLTGAPGGGPSGGVTRAIAYLNVVSDGAFTGDLRIAATGRLGPDGHVSSIDHIDAKTAVAHLADADVLFTPSAPTSEVRDTYGARFVGELVRDPSAAVTLNDPKRIETFHQWGTSRPDGMDIVDARHLIDVASYLCGTGSTFACHITELLDRQAQQRFDQLQNEARSESERLRTATRRSGSTTGTETQPTEGSPASVGSVDPASVAA